MAASFKQLKYCNNKTQDVVNGYIHEIQKIFPWKDNSYFIIPELINHICLSFYWIRFAFNKQYMGVNLALINDTTLKKIEMYGHAMCLIGDGIGISSEFCNTFNIEYTIKEAGSPNDFCPYIGFLKWKNISCSTGINWNDTPGYGNKNSVGICIYSKNPHIIVFENKERLHIDCDTNVGDRFMLQYNFKKSECYIYHNDNKLNHVIKMNCTHIIPCLSLYITGEVTEITKYEFR